jgi:hypothetical protein
VRLPMIRGVLALFFYPSFAKRISREHHEHLNAEMKRRDQLRQAGERPQEEPWPNRQVAVLRDSWLAALFLVLSIIIGGWISGVLLARFVGPGGRAQVALQFLGAGLLLWATLGLGGWSVQTMDGETFAEKLDLWVFRVLHVVGTVILVAATTWAFMIGTAK